MRHGSLFSGIGGFDLAAEWMGWTNVFNCEIDPFCRKVLLHHFPNSYQHEDIRTTDFTFWRNRIDLITGGFPCQPYSTAGKRKGKDDDRHLWPQMLRAIREISPSYVVGENVRGLTNWNGGLVFDEVQADLETEGYEVLPFLLPAAAVGAPHRRDRIWFVAHSPSLSKRKPANEINAISESREAWFEFGGIGSRGVATNANSGQRFERGLHTEGPEKATGHTSACDSRHVRSGWQDFPTQPPVCNRNDGVPGRLVDITFSRWRKESIKALGNAIVPQVAHKIFKAIEQYENSVSNL